jgi:gliding motility-associated-like protein
MNAAYCRIVFLAIACYFGSIASGFSQNLVPNGGFEEYTALPNWYGEFYLATGWSNVNGNITGPPFASPDYFHTQGSVPNAFGTIAPHSGNGQMGFYTYLQVLVDAREYVSTQLTQPLVPGGVYELSFFLTNGFNGIYTARIDNIAIHFSEGPLSQNVDEVIQLTPTLEIPGVVSLPNFWQEYTFTFTATDAADHITFGNFELDATTTVQGGNTAYYFIDDIVLTPIGNVPSITGINSICQGDSTTLSAVNVSSYSWSESSNPSLIISTDSSITVSPTELTTYFLYTQEDTLSIQVTVNEIPFVDLGADTTLCEGDSYELSSMIPAATYVWQDNSSDTTFMATQTGTYWLSVEVNNCLAADTIQLLFEEPPNPNLGVDTSFCQGEVLLLNASTPNASYAWQDNSQNSNLSITQTGVYWVAVDLNGCVKADTITVTVIELPIIDLGADTILCAGDTLLIDASLANASYYWQDSSTVSSISVSETGNYWVSVEVNNCSASDSVYITFQDLPVVNLGEDTTLCESQTLSLGQTNINATYLWQDNSTNSIFKVGEPGIYWVIVTQESCSASDTIIVSDDNCMVSLELPNAFSPNDDGINDIFIPKVSEGIVSMNTIIYSRWGNLVHESNKLQIEWNGQNANDGTYFWVVSFIDIFGNNNKQKGSVTILR